MEQCIGIKVNGDACKTMCIDTQRCKIHERVMNIYGPNTTRRKELQYIRDKHIRIIMERYSARLRDGTNRQEAIIANRAELRMEKIEYEMKVHQLETIIAADTLQRGNDADRPFNIRRHEARIQRQRNARNRQAIRQQNYNYHVAQQYPQAQEQGLRDFAQDRQNIHTTLVVQKVKEMVEQILKIPVPEEYNSLKTPGEIILECQLTKQAAQQMMNKYCEDVDIYDLGIGIYPKVLNSVWQYIKHSEHSTDLKKILSVEMQDNIGMCQQGNLTRLCNILIGYLDGLEMPKTTAEILGEKFSELSQRETSADKVQIAQQILTEHNVPQEEWAVWIEAL